MSTGMSTGMGTRRAAAAPDARETGQAPARVLVVWCPDWPVIAAGADPDLPVAVVGGSGEPKSAAGVVAACSPAARAAGVRRGQRLRDAQRHCPELAVHRRDPAREIRAFEPVVALVESYAPAVEVVRAGVCAIGVRGPARYFGGEEALARLIRDAVGELDPAAVPGASAELASLGCGVGVADGVFAALLAARADTIVPPGGARAFLAPMPTGVLELPELTRVLDGLGIRTVGDFAALPSARVAERFGTEDAMAHRLARGLDPRPLAPRRAGAELAVTAAFDPPAVRADQVVFAAKSLAEEFHQRLAAAGVACVRVGVEVTGTTGDRPAATSLRLWRHDGLLSALAVAERVRWQLDGQRFDDRAAGRPVARGDDAANGRDGDTQDGAWAGVTGLRLFPDQVVVDRGRQLGLWGEDVLPDRVARAVDRVRALTAEGSSAGGHDAVTRPVLVGGRSPAERAVRVPWGDVPARSPHDGCWPGAIPDPSPPAVWDGEASEVGRPPVEVSDGAGGRITVDGRALISARPAALILGAEPLRIRQWAGPWPAQERWWDTDRQRRRAYLQCVTDDGAAWLLALEAGAWHIAARY